MRTMMARPKLLDADRKDQLLSLRLTADQIEYLDTMSERIEAATGFPASRSAVAVRLLELGKTALEKEYPRKRTK
jgi:hypothetical protein